MKSYDPKVLSQESKLAINSSDKCVRFYFETEFDIFQNKGSVQNVELFVTSLYNQVAILYQNENIGTYISQIFVWNTTDPYTETNTLDLLNKFKDTRTSFEGDLGHLLTFRSVGGGRAAGYNGLCNNSTGEKLAVAGISPTFNNFPIYSWPVKVITHEFGHLLGSQHTHACIWNGNNTAIDGCVNTTCWNPGHPSGGGTIMSYCNQIPGVGVNFTKGFGTQPGNVIRNSVANASCLCNCLDSSISGTSYLCSTSSYTLNSPPSGSSISWTASPTNLFSGTTSGTGTSVTLTPYHTNTRGQAKLTFTITRSCGVVQFSKMIWVQAPAPPGPITGNTSPGPGSLTPYYINNLPSGATSMTWSLPYCVGCSQPWSFYSGQNDILMTANVGNSDGYVQAMGVNPCGTGGASLLYVTPSGSCDPCPRMYPNPVSNELSLEWMDTEGFVLSEDIESYQVSLYNAVGGIILTETTNNPSIKIDLSQLKNGFYYLHIENKDGLIRKQIRVER
ncbi:M12 family metallo-peptidase [Algoriphagus sp.]|uniref:M12 family metallo-peptidase n=3 Tax=Algoriphagus sp. TaxID=1872435 RepID=UPI00351E64A4